MDTSKAACGLFEYNGDISTIGARWEKWTEKFNLYVIAENIKDPAQLKAKFLLLMGDQARGIYNTMKKADDGYEQITKVLCAHFSPKRSVYAEICGFRNAKRHEGETVNEYAMRLRELTTYCKFGATIETEIERQFVVGCVMEELQRKCARTDDLDLSKVLEFAIGFERTNASMSKIRGENDSRPYERSTIAYASSEKTKTEVSQHGWSSRTSGQSPGQCGYCGGKPHSDKSRCPAVGKKCMKCDKMNHFARVCRGGEAPTKAKQRPDQIPRQDRNFQSGNHQKSEGWRRNAAADRSRNQVRKVASGEQEQIRTSSGQIVDEADYAEFLRYKASLGFGINTIRDGKMLENTISLVSN